jgi:hypothetical protein
MLCLVTSRLPELGLREGECLEWFVCHVCPSGSLLVLELNMSGGDIHSNFVVVACGGEHGWVGGTPRYCVAAPLVGFELLDQLTGFLVPDEDVAI